jgi:hypothetical protein
MEDMKAFVGERIETLYVENSAASEIYASLLNLFGWLEHNEYRGYDTFDGLSARFARPFTFGNSFLRIALQQGVRRFPLNLRPILGVRRAHSSKAMGFFARGFLRMFAATRDPIWESKADFCLQWLIANSSPGYSGACWGNHFDYQSRGGEIPKGVPTIVWTSLIGHAFLDAYDLFHNEQYLQVAISICTHIMRDLKTLPDGQGACINYTPGGPAWVHNSNTLGGSILARTFAYTKNDSYRELAQKAMQYTAQYQRPDGSWYYGEKWNLHWVDNFHTGYVLDCFKHYADHTGDHGFDEVLGKGYEYWKRTFFLPSGIPKYYNTKTLPLDIQCASQAIDTLTFFSERDPEALDLALNVARWTIANMQDKTGYFYYRRYSRWVVNKTPTLHWGQATMLCALGGLYQQLQPEGAHE